MSIDIIPNRRPSPPASPKSSHHFKELTKNHRRPKLQQEKMTSQELKLQIQRCFQDYSEHGWWDPMNDLPLLAKRAIDKSKNVGVNLFLRRPYLSERRLRWRNFPSSVSDNDTSTTVPGDYNEGKWQGQFGSGFGNTRVSTLSQNGPHLYGMNLWA